MIRIVLLALLLSGCGSALVNIPPLPGDISSHDANAGRVLKVERVALEHAVKLWPPSGGIYAVQLPEGTTDRSRERVVKDLPEGLSTPEAFDGSLPTYKVAQVYIRGMDARVDIIAPVADGGERLVSIFERVDISGWYVRRSKRWNLPVEEALRIIRSTPGAESEEAPKE